MPTTTGPARRLHSAPGWTADDAARALLLTALPNGHAAAAETLYRQGDAAEKRAVLRALPLLPIGAECVPLLHDAIRTNDTRLVAAALGPWATEHLDDAAYDQAVLKCVFIGVPITPLDAASADLSWTGAVPADGPRHPIAGMPPLQAA